MAIILFGVILIALFGTIWHSVIFFKNKRKNQKYKVLKSNSNFKNLQLDLLRCYLKE